MTEKMSSHHSDPECPTTLSAVSQNAPHTSEEDVKSLPVGMSDRGQKKISSHLADPECPTTLSAVSQNAPHNS